MGLTVLSHKTNRGYGGGQKTGYLECIRQDFDAVVLVHGDNQYDPSQAPLFISKIIDENYDVVTGTRMIIGDVLSNGMPLWKYLPNRFLTALENMTFWHRAIRLSQWISGLFSKFSEESTSRAFKRKV